MRADRTSLIRRTWNQARQTELARHGFLLFVALTVANLSNYFFHVVVSRMLGPEDYGALGALLSAFIIISVPAGALQVVIAKKVAVLRATGDRPGAGRVLRSMLGGSLVAALLLGLVATLASPLVSRFLHLESLVPSLILAGYMVFAIVTPVIRGGLQGQMQFTPLAALAAGTTILRLVAGVVFVRLGWGLSGAVGASLLAEAAGLLLGVLPLRQLISVARPGRIPVKGILRDAQMAMLTFGGFWAIVSLDTLLVRHFLPGERAGFYAAAAVAAHTVLFLPGAIAMVAFPRFAESFGQSVEARRTLFHSIVAVGVIGLLAALFLSVFRSLVIRTLFGEAYLPGAPVVGILALAMALLGVANILIYFHLASNSRALLSLIPAVAVQGLGIALFHESLIGVSLVMLAVSAGLTLFNLVAAYAQPGDPRVQPDTEGELWKPFEAGIDISVVTPAFNPGPSFRSNLETLFTSLKESGRTFEVIAVSDGSTDGSQELVRELAPQGLRLIHYDVNRGKGYALRMGLGKARGRYVAFIDSDGDLNPSELASFLTLMDTYDVDLVVGSKRHPLSEVSYPPMRRLMSWGYHWAVRVLFGIKLKDTQTGLKLAKREVLAKVLPRMLEKRFAFDLEMLVVAKALGFTRFMEAPVKLNYQFTSTIAPKTAIGTVIDTLAIFYRRYILRYYHQPSLPIHAGEHEEDLVPVEIAELH
ncbi:MAG: glycosyltransferase [Actinobacteria bacterium]|nr:glycosyltransferase [Actinomycetota bacterium]